LQNMLFVSVGYRDACCELYDEWYNAFGIKYRDGHGMIKLALMIERMDTAAENKPYGYFVTNNIP
jgi:hypothetical protein